MRHALLATCLLLTAIPAIAADEPAAEIRLGHSAHGPAFDEGPRQKPWRMEGIGRTHFRITTTVPEVQAWFDQGNTLLHNFWWFEAERSFRWCLKLDPECAMAYWGMARAGMEPGEDSERALEFLRKAVELKHQVTDHERRYIEAWAKSFLPEWSDDPEATSAPMWAGFQALIEELEQIIIDYPDDDEARVLYALTGLFNPARFANEAVIREVLASNPEHPGAHHYRIHTWDGEDGRMAIESCEIYGRLAWYSGHANHMPGHVYSGIGMWHEGAIWMDSATRVEKRYMQRRMTLPFHNWNYAHNRNYLSFIQEQLGMPELALDGARQLLRAPMDPKYNSPEKPYSVRTEGMQAMVRGLIKYERWDEILSENGIPWGPTPPEQMARVFAEGLAHVARGDVTRAVEQRIALSKLDAPSMGPPDPFEPPADRTRNRMLDELGGRIAIARGNTLEGLQILGRAAQEQWEHYHDENDPPGYPHLLYTVLGEIHLDLQSPGQAALCFEKTLENVPNDAFALSGLTHARYALGDSDGAREACGRLLHVWSDAEPGLRWLTSVEALDLEAEPIDDGPKPQRNYASQTLDTLGPEVWEPYRAPALSVLDPTGAVRTLEDYRGSPVLLVFYLGEGCVHCVEQLKAIGDKATDFESRDVALVAVSSSSPEQHAASLTLGEFPFELLSDTDHTNARRFHAYDDFEEIELHATIFIDADGRIRWARAGGDPFMDIDFLLKEVDRVLAETGAVADDTEPDDAAQARRE